jgi:hypothetical protein
MCAVDTMRNATYQKEACMKYDNIAAAISTRLQLESPRVAMSFVEAPRFAIHLPVGR